MGKVRKLWASKLALKHEEELAPTLQRLKQVFRECHRVLKVGGIFVFTYHHKAISAWLAVGEALARSGFTCTSVLPLRGEGKGGLHSYNDTIKWAAVFICRKDKGAKTRNDGKVVVSRKAIDEAAQRSGYFADRLAAHAEIGFREPGRLNLQRAMVATSAVIISGKSQGMPVRAALERIQNQGDTDHA